MRPRVLILAADFLARAGLAAILSAQTELEIVGQAPLDDNLDTTLQAFRPDVILWDVGFADDSVFLLLAEQFGIEGGELPTLTPPVLALLTEGAQAPNAWQVGIRALLLRTAPPSTLAAALRAAAARLVVHDPSLQFLAINAVERAEPDEPLTPREQEVLQLIAQGLPNKTIARSLQISEHTVKFHVNAILGKLGAQSRTEAVVRASRAGLVLL